MMKLNPKVKMMNRIITLLVVVLLSSCASDSVTIKYYKLGGPEKISQLIDYDQNKVQLPLILIEPITLADFLRQPGLVIQKTDHQLQISNIHRWSEDLERATSRIIRKQLQITIPDYRVEIQNTHWKAKPKFILNIELEEFHIVNHQKQVVTSGRFWLFGKDRTLLMSKSFRFAESMNKNGYEHAVSKLELSLRALSQMISKNFKE